jgi:hypothetical protein
MPWRLGHTYSRCYPRVWRPSPPFTTLGQQRHGDWDPLVVAATLHIWRHSPPFVTLGGIMPWWLGPTYHDLKPVVDLDFILKIIVVLPEIHFIYFYMYWHFHARTKCLGSASDKNLKSLLLLYILLVTTLGAFGFSNTYCMSTVVDLRHGRVNDKGVSQLKITLMGFLLFYFIYFLFIYLFLFFIIFFFLFFLHCC